ncbi:MAG: winged helix-turn-helix transcriptional regulator [Candidatus Micrarchaeota archaeon]|nr:winged helix-turn-helix transcriptional regulator [Candidatus Micrarchaeota archaeon]
MSKTLETKRRILSLLKRKEMTISGISEILGLSTATISQHMDELVRAGAIERIENEHFRKLKYYRAVQTANPMTSEYVKYVIGVVAVLAIISMVYLYRTDSLNGSAPGRGTTAIETNSSFTTTTGGAAGTGAPVVSSAACPMMYYQLNGSIYNYSNMTLHYINSSGGAVSDYVMMNGSSGSLYGVEHLYRVLQQGNSTAVRDHYAYLVNVSGSGGMGSSAPGINVSVEPVNFSVVDNSTINVTIGIAANSTAGGTYWLRVDGPCGGGVTPVLVTIGSRQYNGSIGPPVSTIE